MNQTSRVEFDAASPRHTFRLIPFRTVSLRRRLVIMFVLLVLLSGSLVTLITSILHSRTEEQEAIDQLQVIASLKERGVEEWREELTRMLLAGAKEPATLPFAEHLVAMNPDPILFRAASEYVRRNFERVQAGSGLFSELMLTKPDGQVVVSTDASNVRPVLPNLTGLWPGSATDCIQTLGHDLAPEETSFLVICPLVEGQNRVLALMAGRARPTELAEILGEPTGFGRTGKAYLVGPDGRALTPLPLVESGPRGDGVGPALNTEGVNAVLESRTGGFRVYQDYRGVPVVGVYRWLPDLGAALVVEKDLSEALDLAGFMTRVNVGVMAAVMLVTIPAALLLLRTVTIPLGRLTDTATRIEAGELDLVAPVERDDEIGALARAFNAMTARLRDSIRRLQQNIAELSSAREEIHALNADLERRVVERTRQLDEANRELRRQATRAEALAEFSHVLVLSRLDLESGLDTIARRTSELTGDAVVVRLLSHDGSSLIPVAFHQADPEASPALRELLAQLPRSPSEEPFARVIAAREPRIIVGSLTRQIRSLFPSESGYDPAQLGIQSVIIIPLQIQDQVIGVLDLWCTSAERAHSIDDWAFLRLVAARAALAISNARLYEGEQHARQVAETLRAASLALTRTLDLDAVLDSLLDYLACLVPYDTAAVGLLGSQPGIPLRVVRARQQGADPGLLPGAGCDPRACPLVELLLAEGESRQIADTRLSPGRECLLGAGCVRDWLGVPLVASGTVIGFYSMGKREPGFFTEEHRHLAEALAAQASVAVQNASLFDEVRAGRERLRELSHQLVEVQEAERRSIARELHDDASQALTSLGYGLLLLEEQPEGPEVATLATELKRMADNVLEGLHRLAANLRPASLDHVGLVAALRQHVNAVSSQHGLTIQFESVGFEGPRLPAAVETALYRIVQEALANIVRHAHAAQAGVFLMRSDDRIVVAVEDDGVGFVPETAAESGRLGLFGMRERAEMLGGTLVVESAPHLGTTIVVEVPNVDSHPDRG